MSDNILHDMAAYPPNIPHNASGPRLGAVTLALLFAMAGVVRPEIVISQKPEGGQPTKEQPSVVPDPEGAAREATYDTLEFISGDKLRGTFFSADSSRGVRWRHPAIRQVLEIDPSSIAFISLKGPQGTNAPSNQTCLVKLTNEDQLLGELISLDEKEVTLNTWYAGALTIPRSMVRLIAPGQSAPSAVYEGPVSLDEWKAKSNSGMPRGNAASTGWQFKDGALYSMGNGSIGREVALPAMSRIEFDLAWNGYLQLGFSFYSQNLESYGGHCYMLQLSSGSVYLSRMNKDGNSTNLGHAEAKALAQRSKVRVTVLSDKEQKAITLLINGVQIKQWSDRGDFSPGTGLAFFQQGQGVIRLSNIRVAAWDGKIEQPAKPGEKSKEDLVRLGNNDKISGALKAIRQGTMSFGTEFATLEVPLSRIQSIEMAGEAMKSPERKPTDIRAVFQGRGSVTLTLDRWDDQQIVGTSTSFGPVKFQPAAFTRIDFNLDKRAGDPDLMELDDYEGGFPVFFDN